uniref:Leucine rich immune protein (Coil-less) n=1 Tax=Anopheles stephensi TaxID=30069 RepID=A0A182Y1B7_ANOST
MYCTEVLCEIEHLAPEDSFAFQYIANFPGKLVLKHIPMEHMDRSVLQKVPNQISCLHIKESASISWISVPRSLRCLSVDSSSLSRMDIEPSSTIRQLVITQCDLVHVPRTVKQARSLALLKIWKCKLRELDLATVCDNGRLDLLILKENEIRYVVNSATRQCSVYDSLTSLLLSRNRIVTIDLTLFRSFVRLEHLYLASNRLTSVTGPMVQQALYKLDLNSNRLSHLSFCDWHLPLLSILWISSNRLAMFPNCMNHFTNLTVITAVKNELNNFTIEALAGMDSLISLTLSYNSLTSVTMTTERFPANLQIIDLDHNNLTALNLPSIPVQSVQIDATANRIAEFDVNGTSANVSRLLMQGNPIDCSWYTPHERAHVQCVRNTE